MMSRWHYAMKKKKKSQILIITNKNFFVML